MTDEPAHPDVTVTLADPVEYRLIQKVARRLRSAGHFDAAATFVSAAVASPSYTATLLLIRSTVGIAPLRT